MIGSGIAGLSVAYELTRAGKDVIVLDRGSIGGGMTSRTTAHLSSYSDDGFRALIDMRGVDIGKSWRESQAAAIARIEAIQRELGVDCNTEPAGMRPSAFCVRVTPASTLMRLAPRA